MEQPPSAHKKHHLACWKNHPTHPTQTFEPYYDQRHLSTEPVCPNLGLLFLPRVQEAAAAFDCLKTNKQINKRIGEWEGSVTFNCNRSLSKCTVQLPEQLDEARSTGARMNISELHIFLHKDHCYKKCFKKNIPALPKAILHRFTHCSDPCGIQELWLVSQSWCWRCWQTFAPSSPGRHTSIGGL